MSKPKRHCKKCKALMKAWMCKCPRCGDDQLEVVR
jgi:RNA polymerase subunit RPABC4/transcription elongation factor Spt4